MYSSEELSELREKILSLCSLQSLPKEDQLIEIVNRTVNTLEHEAKDYRPKAKNSHPGGLLDLTGRKNDIVIVPDLHARPTFISNLLASNVTGEDLLSAMNEDRCTVICVGDGVHTETRGGCYERWIAAYEKWNRGEICSHEMCFEIKDCMATMLSVMELKNAFPENFHFLKGNHENIQNEYGGGDYPFCKFAQEGQMVRDFMQEVYSEATLHVIRCFERALPIVAVCRYCVVSHGEPSITYSKNEIINYHDNPEVIYGFTWTDNGEAKEGSVPETFKILNRREKKCLWFGGHRSVPGKYLLRQNGTYVQIHNPYAMNVAVVHEDGSFDLEKDIKSVLPEENKSNTEN
ncbi:MAG TPA: hypothetical protein DEO40_01200 [Treponema sp.]|nr:hypothetical protein [Treponema sp.]